MTKFLEVQTASGHRVTISLDAIKTIHESGNGTASISYHDSGGNYGGGVVTIEHYESLIERLHEVAGP